MIQIDDAGSGSLIGGTGIGIFNTLTSQYYFDIIPLEYYQTKLFYEKSYQDYVIKIVKDGFKKLGVTKEQTIEVCQGYMFDKLREWLDTNGYNWKNTRINGQLQYLVEESFNQYVFNLGLPKAFIKHARYAFGFHRLLKWVFADIENRKKLCKTQWKSWQKWGNIEKSIYPNHLSYPDYCLKCGQKMQKDMKVITIEYMTNKPATINLHEKCFQGDLNPVPPPFLRKIKIFVAVNKINKTELKTGQELFFSISAGKIHFLDSEGNCFYSLTNRLANTLAFWFKWGFIWQCVIQEISESKILLVLTLKERPLLLKKLIKNQ